LVTADGQFQFLLVFIIHEDCVFCEVSPGDE